MNLHSSISGEYYRTFCGSESALRTLISLHSVGRSNVTSVPRSLLAIDLETASPNEEPGPGDYQDTEYFEPVAIGLGYQPRPGADVETEVFLRRGGWEPDATSGLLRRVDGWCTDRDADGVLTYGGARFEGVHLKGWARWLAREGIWPEAPDRYDALFSNHVDLEPLASARYRDRLEPGRDRVGLDDAREWERLDGPVVQYGDYRLGRLVEHGAIESDRVTDAHVGKVLGEAYVRHRVQGTTGTLQFRELERLLRDYARADVESVCRLARRFAGQ